MALYRTLTILMALICLGFGLFSAFVIPKKPALSVKVPRLRIAGIVIGVIALMYCAYAGCQMLPGSRWCSLFWALVPVSAVLLGYYMDYLFARAFGGMLVILTNYLIQHAFAYHCGGRAVYAITAVIWGVAGLVFLAWPWRLRDFWSACTTCSKCRYAILAAGVISAALLAILPFVG